MRIADHRADYALNSEASLSEARTSLAHTDFVDRAPPKLSAEAPLRDAVSMLRGRALWGVPVLDRDGQYLGICTVRSVIARCLPVMASALSPHSSLSYLHTDARRLQMQLQLEADRPVAELLDTDVPIVRDSTSLPQLLLILSRRSPLAVVLSDVGRHLLGVATWERAIGAVWPHPDASPA